MRKLMNTLYITSEDAYLSLKGETVEALFDDGTHKAIPLHTLEQIVCFSYKGASPALMGKCVENGILLSFYTPSGRYLADTGSNTTGNVYLRRTQYRLADDEEKSLDIARNMIIGKLLNSKYLMLHYLRDHPMSMNGDAVHSAADRITGYIGDAKKAVMVDELRGIEGNAAAEYFGVFDEMILRNKTDFFFAGRNRRPPTDPVNALLSFLYSLLSSDCAAALRSVGLDPFVGFMHSDRPGRVSLALDIMEELRSVFADRFVLTLINNQIVQGNDFETQENGAVMLKDSARKTVLAEWQKRKKEEITHPFLKEKLPWGLVPFVQALLLARFIRGDMDGYPPFLWK